nr:immunoglobulin light chain junction region [Macaca mulatta]MOY11116.1 immunoglobulin light chain junction region [Macaca mulatta]MOY11243.1 immunoglobulin light chain junction region [Macaca mulatta]MOY13078.1 immunoglobulin light chain junction region [Macaca mulatta]MOY13159.1 immunoglobulin light chain junction region [Macaca mulatta]
CQHSFGYPYSF